MGHYVLSEYGRRIKERIDIIVGLSRLAGGMLITNRVPTNILLCTSRTRSECRN